MSISPGVLETFDTAIETCGSESASKAVVMALKAHAQVTSEAADTVQSAILKLADAVTSSVTKAVDKLQK